MASEIDKYLEELLRLIEEGAETQLLWQFIVKVRRESYVKGVLSGMLHSPEDPPYLPEIDA
jgi:hypothetical protein